MNFSGIITIFQFLILIQALSVHRQKMRVKKLLKSEMSDIQRDIRKLNQKMNKRPKGLQQNINIQNYYTPWTGWSSCSQACIQKRERYCKRKRICGDSKHTEERKCKICYLPNQKDTTSLAILQALNAIRTPVHQEIYQSDKSYLINRKRKGRNRKKPLVVTVTDYDNCEDSNNSSEECKSYQVNIKDNTNSNSKSSYKDYRTKLNRKRNLVDPYKEYLYDYDEPSSEFRQEYNSEEYDYDYESEIEDRIDTVISRRNTSINNGGREKSVIEVYPPIKRVYSKWSKWTKCSAKCTTRRYKKCRIKEICGKEVIREIAYCYTKGSFCQEWLQSELHKNQNEARLTVNDRKDINVIKNDYIIDAKGYRGPEYQPLKLKCGLSDLHHRRKNSIFNMLKIIGGKTARKGQWPWQVVIFNRYKEAFCGGTLIAPNWILTAAHCVRKVLYVRLGEHNLDIKDGTEVEYRVTKYFKHPNFDKKTVDSDIALLRLPIAINTSVWIGFACMPQPYQTLPKNIFCTVIGWGKRHNRDSTGTSLLHQADVPIITMDNCKSVYSDYKITKNMFCAGHKRGRVDTCAGDSGGPLLCRDITKLNHPWTIFGITSFGDGCAKRNKFGIYAKVPNYVDWVWSVINCDGNCKENSSKKF